MRRGHFVQQAAATSLTLPASYGRRTLRDFPDGAGRPRKNRPSPFHSAFAAMQFSNLALNCLTAQTLLAPLAMAAGNASVRAGAHALASSTDVRFDGLPSLALPRPAPPPGIRPRIPLDVLQGRAEDVPSIPVDAIVVGAAWLTLPASTSWIPAKLATGAALLIAFPHPAQAGGSTPDDPGELDFSWNDASCYGFIWQDRSGTIRLPGDRSGTPIEPE
ncbi:MAG: hypothetical protein ABW032_04245, partial [Burkholderiaceae bacterium]